MPTVHTNGIDLYYERQGRGERLVLLPGLGSSSASYTRIITSLSANLEVVAVDNRGSGRSAKPDLPYSTEMMAEDTAGLLDVLDGPPSHILGHSMGGRIALALALGHPELVRSLVLVSTGPRAPPGTRERVRRRGAFWRRNPLLQRLDPDSQPYPAFLHQLEASRGFDCTDQLGQLQVPTLILHGTRDRLAPLAIANEMHAKIRGSRMVIVPGGHLVLFIQRERCLRAISEFVSAQAGGAPVGGPRMEPR